MSYLDQVNQMHEEYSATKNELKGLLDQIYSKYTVEQCHAIFKTFEAQTDLEYIHSKLNTLEVPLTTKWSDESMRPVREFTIQDIPLEEIALLANVKDTLADLLKFVEDKTAKVNAKVTEIRNKDPEIYDQFIKYKSLDSNRMAIKTEMNSVSGAQLQVLGRAKRDSHESLTETCRKAETYAKLTHRPEIFPTEVQKGIELNEQLLRGERIIEGVPLGTNFVRPEHYFRGNVSLDFIRKQLAAGDLLEGGIDTRIAMGEGKSAFGHGADHLLNVMAARRAEEKEKTIREINATWAKIQEEMGVEWVNFEKARDIRHKLEVTKQYFYRLKNKGSRRVTNEIIKNTLAKGGSDLKLHFGYTLLASLQVTEEYLKTAIHYYRNFVYHSETFKRFIEEQDALEAALRRRYLMTNNLYGEYASRPKVHIALESEGPLIDSFSAFQDLASK